MPKLVKLYITQCLIGFGIAGAFVAMILWFNLANLGHLVANSDAGLLAVFLLWFSNGIVFAGVQFGISVMRLGQNEKADDGPRGGLGVPVRVKAAAPRGR